MAQLFPRRANSISRVSLGGGIAGLLLLAAIYWVFLRTPAFTGVGQPLEQPVPFNHEIHAKELGIDCRYCHTTVETSAFAGMPDTKTCMNCHSIVLTQDPRLAPVRASAQSGTAIQWNTVNNLPDYVYFDHSAHVNKGIGCSSCHGAVDQEPTLSKGASLQMGFCVNCHTRPEQQIRPQDQIFNMEWSPPANQAEIGAKLMQEDHVQSKLSCSVCHR
ncbi:MAG TPA: cytochrome c3 family protein [Chloroflexota bacterium]|nr:cytochrome c3 family protein [Chloroflexota bacterium]